MLYAWLTEDGELYILDELPPVALGDVWALGEVDQREVEQPPVPAASTRPLRNA
jgi:hypothetical protein